MAREQPRRAQHHESDQGAVFSAERQADEHPVVARGKLSCRRREQLFPRFGLSDEPAHQRVVWRGVASRALDTTVDAAFLPGDQAGPPAVNRVLEDLRQPLEHLRAGPDRQRDRDRGTQTSRPEADRRPQAGADRRDGDARRDQPHLVEADSGQRRDEAAERGQLGLILQVTRARNHRDAVGRGGAA